MAQGLTRAGWGPWGAVLWQSIGNTLFGYGAWAWLMLNLLWPRLTK